MPRLTQGTEVLAGRGGTGEVPVEDQTLADAQVRDRDIFAVVVARPATTSRHPLRLDAQVAYRHGGQ